MTYTSKLKVIVGKNLRQKTYDKRDYFNLPIANFPFICSNIPAAPAYEVYISQMKRCSRACGSYHNFLDRGLLLARNQLNQGSLLVSWSHHFVNLTVVTMTWLTTMEYLCHKWPHIYSPCRKHFPVRPHSIFITGFVTRLTRRVPLVEQELLTLSEHMSSPPVFSGVRVTRSLVVYVCFVDRCLSFCTFSFGQCVFCSSLIYGFRLPLWYLQTFRKIKFIFVAF
jgi:hypothetical protein